MSEPAVVLFDIDGTLIDTGGAGAAAWRIAFRDRFGVEVDIAAFSEVGQTDPDVARQSFIGALGREPDTNEIARLVMGYVMALPDAVAASDGYRVLPGVPEVLDRLARDGALLGLVTGNVEGAAHIKLGRAGLNRYFPFGGYGSDAADRGELTRTAIARAETIHGHPVDPASVMVVGDTPRDVEAAHDAGAVSIAVATGRFSVAELASAGADQVLPTLEAPFPPSN